MKGWKVEHTRWPDGWYFGVFGQKQSNGNYLAFALGLGPWLVKWSRWDCAPL